MDVNPTESEEKVRKAISNVLGDVSFEVKSAQKGIVLAAHSKGVEPLVTLGNVLRRDHIRDASRKALHHAIRGCSLVFYLNKQAASAGHVSFSEAEAESPLGPIRVVVVVDDPLQLIDWLAPRTSKSEG